MEQILDNQNYFEKQMQGIVLKRFRTEQQFPVQPADIQAINRLLVREYLKESGRIWGCGFSSSFTGELKTFEVDNKSAGGLWNVFSDGLWKRNKKRWKNT